MIIRQIKNGKKKKKKVFSQHKFQGRSEKQRSKKGLIVKFAFKGQFKHFWYLILLQSNCKVNVQVSI